MYERTREQTQNAAMLRGFIRDRQQAVDVGRPWAAGHEAYHAEAENNETAGLAAQDPVLAVAQDHARRGAGTAYADSRQVLRVETVAPTAARMVSGERVPPRLAALRMAALHARLTSPALGDNVVASYSARVISPGWCGPTGTGSAA